MFGFCFLSKTQYDFGKHGQVNDSENRERNKIFTEFHKMGIPGLGNDLDQSFDAAIDFIVELPVVRLLTGKQDSMEKITVGKQINDSQL